MFVSHPPSGITYCDAHFQVVDEQGRCPACDAPEPPAPSPWVDHHCIQRFQERVEHGAKPWRAIRAVRKIVMEGQPASRASADCAYYRHPHWPSVIVVVKRDMNCAITVLLDPEAA